MIFRSTVAGTPGAGGAAVTEEVVTAAPFGVAQRLVGDADLLEPFFGVRVVGLRIGVVPAGEVAVRPLDLLVGGVAGDAERLVVVAGHDRCRPSCSDTAVTAASAWR